MPNSSRNRRANRRSQRRRPRRTARGAPPAPRDNTVTVYRPPSFGRSIIHHHVRSAAPVTLTSSTVGEFLYAFNFQLGYLPGYTEFTALYDQYKINAVELTFLPQVRTSTPTDPLQGWCALAVDYDDATTPANLNSILEYGSCNVFPCDKTIFFRLRPRIAAAVYSGAFTSYGNTQSWIDVGSPAVQHYGLKFGASQSTPAHTWQVFARYFISLRSTR